MEPALPQRGHPPKTTYGKERTPMAQGNDDFEELFEKLNSIEKREREELEQQLPPGRREPSPPPRRAREEEPEQPALRYAKRKRVGRRGHVFTALLYALIVVGVSVILSVIAIAGISDYFGIYKTEREVTLELRADTPADQVADLLEAQGIIKLPFLFNFYLGQKELSPIYQAGTYVLNANMSYSEILSSMSVQSRDFSVVTVTFPEGLNAVQIANLLEKNNVCSADDFIKEIQTGTYNYDFLPAETLDNGRYYRLEGYLFPDTYEFYEGENVSSVVKKFLDNFDRRVETQHYTRMEELGWTVDDVVKLASIVEKESSGSAQMPVVSSVFHNRLNNPGTFPTLDSDVTIFYVNDYIKPNFTTPNQELYDSYNTYRCHGLPVGPITNPGIQAIEAVLYPESTGYYFFVTDDEGNYYYAATSAEHDANVAKAEAVGGAHGTSDLAEDEIGE